MLSSTHNSHGANLSSFVSSSNSYKTCGSSPLSTQPGTFVWIYESGIKGKRGRRHQDVLLSEWAQKTVVPAVLSKDLYYEENQNVDVGKKETGAPSVEHEGAHETDILAEETMDNVDGAEAENNASGHTGNNKRERGKKNRFRAPSLKLCSWCGVKDSPQWRRGPNENTLLCNACGLWYANNKNCRNKKAKIQARINSRFSSHNASATSSKTVSAAPSATTTPRVPPFHSQESLSSYSTARCSFADPSSFVPSISNSAPTTSTAQPENFDYVVSPSGAETPLNPNLEVKELVFHEISQSQPPCFATTSALCESSGVMSSTVSTNGSLSQPSFGTLLPHPTFSMASNGELSYSPPGAENQALSDPSRCLSAERVVDLVHPPPSAGVRVRAGRSFSASATPNPQSLAESTEASHADSWVTRKGTRSSRSHSATQPLGGNSGLSAGFPSAASLHGFAQHTDPQDRPHCPEHAAASAPPGMCLSPISFSQPTRVSEGMDSEDEEEEFALTHSSPPEASLNRRYDGDGIGEDLPSLDFSFGMPHPSPSPSPRPFAWTDPPRSMNGSDAATPPFPFSHSLLGPSAPFGTGRQMDMKGVGGVGGEGGFSPSAGSCASHTHSLTHSASHSPGLDDGSNTSPGFASADDARSTRSSLSHVSAEIDALFARTHLTDSALPTSNPRPDLFNESFDMRDLAPQPQEHFTRNISFTRIIRLPAQSPGTIAALTASPSQPGPSPSFTPFTAMSQKRVLFGAGSPPVKGPPAATASARPHPPRAGKGSRDFHQPVILLRKTFEPSAKASAASLTPPDQGPFIQPAHAAFCPVPLPFTGASFASPPKPVSPSPPKDLHSSFTDQFLQCDTDMLPPPPPPPIDGSKVNKPFPPSAALLKGEKHVCGLKKMHSGRTLLIPPDTTDSPVPSLDKMITQALDSPSAFLNLDSLDDTFQKQ